MVGQRRRPLCKEGRLMRSMLVVAGTVAIEDSWVVFSLLL